MAPYAVSAAHRDEPMFRSADCERANGHTPDISVLPAGYPFAFAQAVGAYRRRAAPGAC